MTKPRRQLKTHSRVTNHLTFPFIKGVCQGSNRSRVSGALGFHNFDSNRGMRRPLSSRKSSRGSPSLFRRDTDPIIRGGRATGIVRRWFRVIEAMGLKLFNHYFHFWGCRQRRTEIKNVVILATEGTNLMQALISEGNSQLRYGG